MAQVVPGATGELGKGGAVMSRMLRLTCLNNFLGDREQELDTSTEEGRAKAAELMQKLLRAGTAIFLERADKTYRVTGYDPGTDRLLVKVRGMGDKAVMEGKPVPKVGRAARAVRADYGVKKGQPVAFAPARGG